MKTYNIKTMFDFTKIPEDRIDACLADFKDLIMFYRGIIAYAQQNGYAEKLEHVEFDWVDDGTVGLSGFIVEIESEGK